MLHRRSRSLDRGNFWCNLTRKEKYRWFVLALVPLTTAVAIMIFAAPFPLLNLWIKDLGISRTRAGALTGLWYLAFALVALPSGWLADRFSLRRLLLSLWALIVVGTVLMGTAPGFWMLCLGRVIFSVGAVGHVTAGPKLLAAWFEGRREFGLIMGFFSMSMTLGVYASLFLLSRIGQRSGWRAAFFLLIVLAIFGFLIMFFVPSQSPGSGKAIAGAHVLSFRLGTASWVLAVSYAGFNVATEAYLTFTPDYLVRHGYGLAAASGIVGVYAWVALSLKPFLSFFLRKSNAAIYVVLASFLFIFCVVLLVIPVSLPAISASMMGVAMALGMPAFYALPPLMVGNERSGRVYGLCGFLYGIGFVLQPLVGLTVDKTGHYAAGYTVICGVAGFALFGAWWLSRYNLKGSVAAMSPSAGEQSVRPFRAT
jgi:cyanate permease